MYRNRKKNDDFNKGVLVANWPAFFPIQLLPILIFTTCVLSMMLASHFYSQGSYGKETLQQLRAEVRQNAADFKVNFKLLLDQVNQLELSVQAAAGKKLGKLGNDDGSLPQADDVPSLNMDDVKLFKTKDLPKPVKEMDLYIYKENDGVSNTIMHFVNWERERHEWVMRHMKSPNGIFVDVGANIGFWLLFMAKFGKQSIGFEPFAQNVEVIESSIFHHKYNNDAWAANAEVHNFGIAEKNLKCSLYSANFNVGDGYSVCPDLELPRDAHFRFRQPIELKRLDDFLLEKFEKKPFHIDVLKIDASGYELRVLKGSTRLFEKNLVSSLAIECNSKNLGQHGGTNPDMLIRFAEKVGFKKVKGAADCSDSFLFFETKEEAEKAKEGSEHRKKEDELYGI